MEIAIIIIVWAALMVAIAITYNRLLAKRNQVDNAYGALDAMLKKRHDLLPNLVKIVNIYMSHEREMLTGLNELIEKISSSTIGANEKHDLDSQLTRRMNNIFILVKNYPALKSDTQFSRLQGAWNEVEEQIAAARRACNASITDYNNAIEGFPGNMFAKNMKLEPKSVLQIPEEEKKNLDVSEALA